MASPYTLRWGILATGGIAKTFAKDLLIDPSTRNVSDIKHTVVAAASSSSADRAKNFLEECKCLSSAAAYGSYEELVKDKDVDIIYIATPHSHHYQNAMLCLEAGKNVLCEKAFTVNAAQARKLVDTARAKKLFLMEAVWTRYFPFSIQIRKIIEDGELGAVHRVIGDTSFGKDVEREWSADHRMLSLDLAGGAMLDLGIYALTWVFQILYHTLPPAQRSPPTVVSSMTKNATTGADEMTSILLTFPHAPHNPNPAHGIALTNFRVGTDVDGKGTSKPCIRIQGTKGEIQVDGLGFRAETWRIIWTEDGKGVEEHTAETPGHGMFWEADEAARCIRDGKQQSDGLDWEESVVIMETMDQVRKQNGLVYPEKIETVEYPIKL